MPWEAHQLDMAAPQVTKFQVLVEGESVQAILPHPQRHDCSVRGLAKALNDCTGDS